jgi:hypothetical protein
VQGTGRRVHGLDRSTDWTGARIGQAHGLDRRVHGQAHGRECTDWRTDCIGGECTDWTGECAVRIDSVRVLGSGQARWVSGSARHDGAGMLQVRDGGFPLRTLNRGLYKRRKWVDALVVSDDVPVLMPSLILNALKRSGRREQSAGEEEVLKFFL